MGRILAEHATSDDRVIRHPCTEWDPSGGPWARDRVDHARALLAQVGVYVHWETDVPCVYAHGGVPERRRKAKRIKLLPRMDRTDY